MRSSGQRGCELLRRYIDGSCRVHRRLRGSRDDAAAVLVRGGSAREQAWIAESGGDEGAGLRGRASRIHAATARREDGFPPSVLIEDEDPALIARALGLVQHNRLARAGGVGLDDFHEMTSLH